MLEHSGMCAILGRPNVGKSTLLNALLGEKVSIATRKPQTTRHRILGVLNGGGTQVVFVDTPGLHQHEKRALNRQLNRAALGALEDIDLALFVCCGLEWRDADDSALGALEGVDVPVILAVNQVDRVKDKRKLLPHLERLTKLRDFAAVVPVSATRGTNLEELQLEVVKRLPQGPALFPAEQITDRDTAFRIGELIREQLIVALGDELPYSTTVQIEELQIGESLTRIGAVVWVERSAQKPIVIGQGGKRLKKVGSLARQQIEELLEQQAHLELWVKVKEHWTDDRRALHEFGYTD
ncbi:GTPase Era [Halorhodospira halochloris]|uniref:GTPase Era n=1 Tax=Halorhodospira halochloris TaxID=1052 RepID=A0A0X8XA58_HALHR|nr:GTPase Era [Halorhodospira halochloris]MBK1652013.1 GTPase Era [Halorhodospira halochloris]MCG5530897.1 GTPase Era [Halorhodospira halochloris]MCG5547889.1 GTPase Era [Halorhodospira halochloris]BAU58311.2 GTP-binding protein Era [Halorhodospira halochloris]